MAHALPRLRDTLGDPRLAFDEPARSQLPGPLLLWSCIAFTVVVAALVACGLWRLFRLDRTALDRRTRLGVGAEARLATARDLRPLIASRSRPSRFGSIALIGPSRSGKTRCAQSSIRTWGHPAILSSVKTDLLAATIDERQRLGEVKMFDPTGVTDRGSAHWTPLRAARSLQGATATAKALVDVATRGEGSGDSHWLRQAEILLTSLLWLTVRSAASAASASFLVRKPPFLRCRRRPVTAGRQVDDEAPRLASPEGPPSHERVVPARYDMVP